MAKKPKIVAINGSPNRHGGNTGQMLAMIGKTLDKEGCELEVICLAEKRIWFCAGCGFCLENVAGKCWIKDEHRSIVDEILAADGVILASPVYIAHVTGQMKVFLDRCLGIGHKPRPTWKPGLAVSVSGGWADVEVANYLSSSLRIFGAFPVGQFIAISRLPGQFLGKEDVEARAKDWARDLVIAITEKRRYPATENDLHFYHFMGYAVKEEQEIMTGDIKHWTEHNLYDGFETYIKQKYTRFPLDRERRKAALKKVFANHLKQYKEDS
jgi:multimeric flavodoxin WrbA